MKNNFQQKNKACPAKLQRSGGFTLVETLVAISIFTVSLLGIMSVLASSIANTSYAKQKMVASYLAQEGIEYIRNMRDTDVLYNVDSMGSHQPGWNVFLGRQGTDIDNDLTLALPVPTGFSRQITKSTVSGNNEVKITSTVSWTQGSGNYNITLSENLFNWVE